METVDQNYQDHLTIALYESDLISPILSKKMGIVFSLSLLAKSVGVWNPVDDAVVEMMNKVDEVKDTVITIPDRIHEQQMNRKVEESKTKLDVIKKKYKNDLEHV